MVQGRGKVRKESKKPLSFKISPKIASLRKGDVASLNFCLLPSTGDRVLNKGTLA